MPIQKLKTILFGLAVILPVALTQAAEVQRPNIILFLVDDMGWTDGGVFGSEYYETPNIDAFAKQAMPYRIDRRLHTRDCSGRESVSRNGSSAM